MEVEVNEADLSLLPDANLSPRDLMLQGEQSTPKRSNKSVQKSQPQVKWAVNFYKLLLR
jgi:hypothetical protein